MEFNRVPRDISVSFSFCEAFSSRKFSVSVLALLLSPYYTCLIFVTTPCDLSQAEEGHWTLIPPSLLKTLQASLYASSSMKILRHLLRQPEMCIFT